MILCASFVSSFLSCGYIFCFLWADWICSALVAVDIASILPGQGFDSLRYSPALVCFHFLSSYKVFSLFIFISQQVAVVHAPVGGLGAGWPGWGPGAQVDQFHEAHVAVLCQ